MTRFRLFYPNGASIAAIKVFLGKFRYREVVTASNRARTISRIAKQVAAWCILCCATANGQLAEPVPWTSHDLQVPYRWNGDASGAASVVLYFSDDRGQNWRQAGVAMPHVRSFNFRAPSDGEYWFAIRTFDALGRSNPAGPLTAEMRVAIDTARPEITKLDAKINQNRLELTLQASDTGQLQADSLQVFAKADSHPQWLPVTLSETHHAADGRSLQATAIWLPPMGAKTVNLRALVADASGNRTEQSTTTSLPAQPAAPLTGSQGAAVDPFALAERQSAPAPSEQRFARPAQAEPPLATPWPMDSPAEQTLASQRPPAPSSSPFSSASFQRGGFAPLDSFDKGFDDDFDDIPRRMVNNTRFDFEYDLEATGRWGVAKVELWGTDNGGRSWRRFAIDSDQQSPIHVTTPGEGEYGFRLVVESVGGLQAPTPQPGDEPEAIVVVDLQRPRVALRGARQGEGYFADQLIIEWRANDRRLAERPVDLFYSNRPTGPWAPIATNLPNSGRHSWRLQRHLPSRPYIKIEVRDAAGNTAEAATPEPVAIHVPTASGALRSVRAARP